MEQALTYYEAMKNWKKAAEEAGNLSVLYLNAGSLHKSLDRAENAVKSATQSGEWQLRSSRLATLGDALIQFGKDKHQESFAAFKESEEIQRQHDPEHPILYSTKGYRFHELLLDMADYDEVLRRTAIARNWRTQRYQRLDDGLIKLMCGRAYFARFKKSRSVADLKFAPERNWRKRFRRSSRQGIRKTLSGDC